MDFETDRSMFFVLDEDHNPVPATVKEWGDFRSKPDGKRVELTQLPNCWVSTVFLGMDHGYGEGAPVLFETMAFEGDYHANGCKDEIEEGSNRYRTWDEAVAGHKEIVSKLTPVDGEVK
jgi:hypothetical protein